MRAPVINQQVSGGFSQDAGCALSCVCYAHPFLEGATSSIDYALLLNYK